MMRKGLLFFFLVVNLFNTCLIGQNTIDFIEEHIDFSLDNKNFSVNGIFTFYNNSNEVVRQRIIFPFAVETEQIDSIRIIHLNQYRTTHYTLLEKAVSFDLIFLPKDTLDISVYYRQKTKTINTYILTSTKMWGKPLDKAVYTLTTTKDMNISSFSYAPDTIRIIQDKKTYYWEKYHFLPENDFDVMLDKTFMPLE